MLRISRLLMPSARVPKLVVKSRSPGQSMWSDPGGLPDGPTLVSQAPPLIFGEPQAPPAELLAENAVLLAQEVDDLKLAGVNPARHPEDQELNSLGAHRSVMVARLVIHLGVRRAMTSHGDTSRFSLGRVSAHGGMAGWWSRWSDEVRAAQRRAFG